MFDSFYDVDGNDSINKIINFTASGSLIPYGKLHEDIVTKWNVCGERKRPKKPMDSQE